MCRAIKSIYMENTDDEGTARTQKKPGSFFHLNQWENILRM